MTSIPPSKQTKDAPLETVDPDIYVLGGAGSLGVAVARRLQDDGHDVTLVDDADAPPDVPTHQADPTDVNALKNVGLDSASTVVVASSSDSLNLLVAQLVRVRFDVDRILVLTHEPDRIDVVSDAGHEPVCATTTLSNALVEVI